MAQGVETTGQGRLRQSVSKWCFDEIPLEAFCEQAAALGLEGIDLLGPEEWAVPPKYGLVCSMAMGPWRIEHGWNRVEHHDELIAAAEDFFPKMADAGVTNVVLFSGNREGQPDDEGLENCAKGLARIVPLAEKHNIILCMELLNSKRDHDDYQCDRTPWGVELCKRVGSERLKLLYDIYHMQIMEGDVIATIQESIDYIAHFHTGGVPGRNEIDETQELYYPPICRAIADTGFDGFLAHEFVPKRDPMPSLKQAYEICLV